MLMQSLCLGTSLAKACHPLLRLNEWRAVTALPSEMVCLGQLWGGNVFGEYLGDEFVPGGGPVAVIDEVECLILLGQAAALLAQARGRINVGDAVPLANV